jgi:hypothetical protein
VTIACSVPVPAVCQAIFLSQVAVSRKLYAKKTFKLPHDVYTWEGGLIITIIITRAAPHLLTRTDIC